MNKYKGVVEKEIGGETVGFKFGMGSMAMLCDLEKDTLKNVIEKLGDATLLKTQINFYYAAAVQYARLFKKEEPNFEQVANWMDCLSADIKEEIGKAAFEQYEDPNVKAPQTEGQS
jgi:hypothetical protein